MAAKTEIVMNAIQTMKYMLDIEVRGAPPMKVLSRTNFPNPDQVSILMPASSEKTETASFRKSVRE